MKSLPSNQKFTSSIQDTSTAEDPPSLLLNNLDEILLLTDLDLKIIFVNTVTSKTIGNNIGITPKEGMNILELAPADRYHQIKDLCHRALTGETNAIEREIDIDGSLCFFQSHFKPAFDSAGAIVGVLMTSKNITKQKRLAEEQIKTEEALKLSEQQYKMLFQSIPLPCWIFDLETYQFLGVNEAALKHYGYTKEEFFQINLFDIHHPQHHEKLRQRIKKDSEVTFSSYHNWEHILHDGRTIFVDLKISSIIYKGINAKLVVANDVTRRVVTENELRNSNERFRLAVQASSEALWEWDVLSGEAFISSAYTDMLGWRADEFRKFDEWHDYIHPDDKEETVNSYYTVINDPAKDSWKKEYRYLKADGTYAYVYDKAVISRDENGKAVKVTGALQDISEIKKIEEELRQSNERFLLAGRASSDALYDWNLDSNELFWGSLQTVFGHSAHEFTMDFWETILHPKEKQSVIKDLYETLAHPRKRIWKREYMLAKTDGTYGYVLERGFIVRDEDGRARRMIGSLQDISEQKFYEQLLSLERYIFELSANPEIELKEVVQKLLEGIEEIHSEAITSVLLLKDNDTVQHLAAPKLAKEYISLIDGTKPGPNTGSCGTAMYFKKTIIVEDIAIDPLWTDFKDIALRFDLHSCWSSPIIHSSGKVLGSFAIYHNKPQHPTATELITVNRLQNILRVIMENRWTLQQIKIANERFDIMMRATHDLVWDWNMETNVVYRDPVGVKNVYGLKDNSPIASVQGFMERLHPDDRSKLKAIIARIFHSETENNFDVEYRFRKADGTYAEVYDRGIILRNDQGKPIRMIGAAQDISERKRLEKELLANELEYQKAINQATVDSQEQERSEIGKELHDNVNQVLTTTKLYLDLALSNPELKDELIHKSTKNILDVINEIRQLSRSLMDPSIGDLGLTDSINDLIENINLTRKLHVSLKAEREIEDLLNKNQKLTIYRIIQEALNNAIRHARATTVAIEIKHSLLRAEVIIEDDGVGFDVQTIKKGAGLKNIQNRIYLINGSHTIESTLNKGSKLIIKFPITGANKLHPH